MDDLISRAAAIKAFMGKPPEYYHTDYIASELKGIPAVDAAPVVHGTWEAQAGCSITRCSVCKWNFEGCIAYKYCPVCGAKMDGE